jgi:thiosulfate reductase cytochrome b subunit
MAGRMMAHATAEPDLERRVIYRHSLVVRIAHWINVVCFTLLLMSGLQIFNAHPALYWGQQSTFDAPFVALQADPANDAKGITRIASYKFDTTGVLGVSKVDGVATERGFPSWATIPSYQSLAAGRRWHFFFAWLLLINGFVYLLYCVLTRHVQHDLAPTRRDWREIGHSIVEHAKLRFPKGEEARRYNVLQKLAYLGVIFGLFPLVILTGLTMSPGMDAGFPQLVAFFGGRQSARTIHFIAAFSLVLFVMVHVVMVLVSGVWNNLRSMITGRYAILTAGGDHEA